MEFACDQCEYKARTERMIKTHHSSMHQGIRYTCNTCGFQASKKVSLTRHQQSIHEGKRYNCNQCGYQATTKIDLTSHQQSIQRTVSPNTSRVAIKRNLGVSCANMSYGKVKDSLMRSDTVLFGIDKSVK